MKPRGLKVLRIRKSSRPAVLSNEDEEERRNAGYVQILLSGTYAELATEDIAVAIKQLMNRGTPADIKTLIRLMRMQKDFVRQIWESGKALVDSAHTNCPVDPCPEDFNRSQAGNR